MKTKTRKAITAIEYWHQQSPFGEITIARTEKTICYLGFGKCADDLHKRFANATITQIEKAIELAHIDTILIVGSDFQLDVWRALLDIKPGELTTYSQIATKIGRPKAVRAVGTAVGTNPISIVIPCHRVVRADGAIGGYHWGIETKRAILASENCPL